MAEAAEPIIRITTPSRTFEGHEINVLAAAVFPDRRRMVTGSYDKTLRLWDLENGIMLKKIEGHRNGVQTVAVSRDGQLIASGDRTGEVIAWNGDGESLTQPIKVHSSLIMSLDFSPDGAVLASGSSDRTTELWNTKTWQVQENPINCNADVKCVRYSPSGQHLAIATIQNIQIWNPDTRECIAKFKGHNAFNGAWNFSLVWTHDGSRLLSAGSFKDPTIREWDASTWKQVGEAWKGHGNVVRAIAINPTGTLVASACDDSHMRLWRLSDRRTIAIFKHSYEVYGVTFSTDGKHILSGGRDPKVSEWEVPDDALLEVTPQEQASGDALILSEDTSEEQVTKNAQVSVLEITSSRIAEAVQPVVRITTPSRTLDGHSRMAEAEPIIRITTPSRTFEGHEKHAPEVAVFPDRRRMVTGSYDKTLRLWDLENGVVLKEMQGHCNTVQTVAVSSDGQFIASGDKSGEVIAWNRDGESLIPPIKVHSRCMMSLNFSPNSAVLASGSRDRTTELWSTKTWQVQENPLNCNAEVNCIRYSPSGQHLAIATDENIQIWNPGTRECIAKFKGHNAFDGAWNFALAWTLDGTRLLSAGSYKDPTIREWDASTWEQVGEAWKGHTAIVRAIAINHTGTLVASASDDSHVRLWRLSDRRTIAIFKHSYEVYSITFSMDGKHILSGGTDPKALEWAVPNDASLEVTTVKQVSEGSVHFPTARHLILSKDAVPEDASEEQVTKNAQVSVSEILAMSMTARDACITGDSPTADRLLTQEINTDGNNYNSYANRSFVMARKSDWDSALHDALKSIDIQPSLIGCISKCIALCGKRQIQEAMTAFDLVYMFVDGDLNTTHLLLLIKAIAIFNARQHDEAILRVRELAATFPSADILACQVVETYLHVQLGTNALDGMHYNEAADHFRAAVNAIAFSSTSPIHSKYEVFVVLFGWDLKSLWRTAHQNWCHALVHAGRPGEALKSYQYMMDGSDESMKESCLDWAAAFKHDCSTLYAAQGVAGLVAKGDTALATSDYDSAIELYSVAIDLDLATDTIFANRCKAKLGKMLWEDALLDAQKVIDLSPSSFFGYQLRNAALHGAEHYDEAIEAFEIMLSKVENAPDSQTQQLRQQYLSRAEAEGAIQETINAQLDNAPHRMLDTFTGRLCNREAQIKTFRMSMEYKELLSSTMAHADLRMERIQDVVAIYFRCVMLSHRWGGKEPLLRDIQDKVVYELNPLGGIAKLQSFCTTARDMGYRWAWVDTCCIDQSNNVEVQQSVNSMFIWYRYSALTIVYLSDVPPLSKSGALANSAWNTRGWTVQEFLAPRIVLFYQKDWTLYLGDRSPNHKESVEIMRELADATGIDAQALVSFRPGMRGAREKLQWVSTRVTTWPEDIAYSLFGIFGVNLAVIYGEKQQKALGRLLQEVVAQSGDISALDWVGQSSEFNSCLPANITSYKAPPYTLPSLSADEIQTSVSLLRNAVAVESASKLYTMLDHMTAPRFANCRLRLPCIAFRVTAVRRSRAQDQETCVTYEVKAGGLRDLLITTEDRLSQFSPTRPTMQTFLLVRPWNRYLLDLPDFAELPNLAGMPDVADDTRSEEDYWSMPGSPLQDSPGESPEEQEPVDPELSERALRLIVRVGQPFSAFLLAQQRGGEYKRIASDRDIIAQVKDAASIDDMMDIRILEIL